MKTLLYVVWFLLPLFFFGIALWAKLEKISNRRKGHDNPGDYFRQGIFVSGCVLASVAIDQFFLEPVLSPMMPNAIPVGVVQTLLLPALLWTAGKIFGPSQEILIRDAPKLSDKKRR